MASKIVDNRVNFASVHNPLPYPDFLDVQLKSFKDFLQLDTPPEERKNDGLYKVFSENTLYKPSFLRSSGGVSNCKKSLKDFNCKIGRAHV